MTRHAAHTTLAFAAALLAATTGCDASATTQPDSGLPVVTMTIAGQKYHLEVAANDASRQHGLMERARLPADHGMVFVFTDEQPRNFWMHHTRFPLDIIYVDHAGKVVSVRTMKAYDETGIPSNGPATYAIELNAGKAADVKPGDTLDLPKLPDAK